MIRLLCMSVLMFGLAACSNLSVSDLATTAGATAGGMVGALTGHPGIAAATTAGGALAGAAIVGDTAATVDACAQNPEVCSTISFYATLQDFWHWLVAGGVALVIAAWLIPGPQRLWGKKPESNRRKRM